VEPNIDLISKEKTMFTSTLKVTAAAIAILAAAAIANSAYAADVVTQSTTIHYRDLNLASADGKATLQHRIAIAARNVCWAADGPSLDDHARFDACREKAIASASPQMNAVIASARSDHRYAMNNDAIAMSVR
jgi:UrcA family protein